MVTKTDILAAMQFPLVNELNPINTSADPRAEITYQYAGTSEPGDFPQPGSFSGWAAFTAPEKSAFEAALAHIETFLNVDFVEAPGASDPDLNVGKVSLPGSTAGFGGYSASYSTTTNEFTEYDSYVVYDKTIDLTSNPNLFLHELGHALGLKHPFADSGASGAPTLPDAFENNKYTIMSYNPNPDNGLESDAAMLFDIFALQDVWGEAEFNAGNTTYSDPRTDTVDPIWDTGGRDALDASGRTSDVTLNLRPGTFSTFDTKDDVVISYGTRIEKAIGGAGDDLLIGNFARNLLKGGGGNDTLLGGGGHDLMVGNAGSDTLLGFKGNDRLFGGTGADTLKGHAGDDILNGFGQNDLLVGGPGDDTLKGHAGNDTLRGFQNNDILIGGGGDDVIVGHAGHDTLIGRVGNDLMFGGAHRDTMSGNGGADTLKGGFGRDVLRGGSGDDTLDGGVHGDKLNGQAGDDTLTGGGGPDKFVFAVGGGNDTITDFADDEDSILFFKLGDAGSIMDLATQVGSDVVFDFGGGDSLTVLDTIVSVLSDDIIA